MLQLEKENKCLTRVRIPYYRGDYSIDVMPTFNKSRESLKILHFTYTQASL